MFSATANQPQIAQNAVQVARTMRDAAVSAQNFYAWISGQADADLTGINFTEPDIVLMRSMAADLNAFANVYHGQAPGGNYVLPYPFVNSSTIIIGAQ
jgi:hypothetical protein